MTTQIKAGVIAANAITASELASSALSGGSFTGDVTFDTDTLVVDSANNRVGVGTSSPSQKLTVEAAAGYLATFQTSDANKPRLQVYVDDTDGVSLVSGYDTTAKGMRFFTGGLNRMEINSSGNVGIGTDNPGGSSTNRQITSVGSTTSQLTLTGGGSFSTNVGTNGVVGYLEVTGANNLALYTNSTERMSIDSSGNVTVKSSGELRIRDDGTFIKEDQGLQIGNTSGTGTTRPIRFFTESSERMRIDSSGNVGIAGTPPSDTNTGYPLLSIGETTVIQGLNDSNESFFTNNAIWKSDNSWEYVKNVRAVQMAFADGNTIFRQAASGTADNDITWSESMRIDTSGNVGIGTGSSAPLTKLHIATAGRPFTSTVDKSNGDMVGLVLTANTNENTMNGIWFSSGQDHTGTHWSGIAGSRSDYSNTWGTHLSFFTHVDATSNITQATEKMRITSEGNVGIGTTSPSQSLDVFDSDNYQGVLIHGSNAPCLTFAQGANTTPTWRTGISGYAGDSFAISTGASVGDILHIKPTGRVFINTITAVGTEDFSYLGPAGSDTTLQIMSPDNTPGREIQLRLTNNNATYYGYGAAFRAVQGGGVNSYTLYVETNATGGVYLSGGGTSWTSNSDERYKTIIEDIDNASEKVSTLRTVIGTFNDDPDSKRRPFLIAQDVQAVLPEAVDDTANPDRLGLSYTDVIPLLTAAIKEQKILIEQLEARIETLENA